MHSLNKVCLLTGLLFIFTSFICSAQDKDPSPIEVTVTPKQKTILFQGEINANNINIRSDSTTSSKIICIANKGEPVEVITESYEWYKIRLLKKAPSFIKKDLVDLIDGKTAKVIKDNVNIRLNPDESSPILGKADKDEVINILEERVGWYKIEPINESFGWVHKRFVAKADTINKKEEVKLDQQTKKENTITDEKASLDENITIEGIIKPYGKVFKRIATHKLITLDNNVFLLKGNKASLNSLNYHKVKVTGKLSHPKNQKDAIIEILKIEDMD